MCVCVRVRVQSYFLLLLTYGHAGMHYDLLLQKCLWGVSDQEKQVKQVIWFLSSIWSSLLGKKPRKSNSSWAWGLHSKFCSLDHTRLGTYRSV